MVPTRAAPGLASAACAAVALAGLLALMPAAAQNFPITPAQRSTAQQVAARGVPLSALAPNAPDSYTVRSGDTLWAISGIFLRTPWRWPELWGMNIDQVRNPHRIYPGQTLYLEKLDGMARLRMGEAPGGPTQTVRVSPRTRINALDDLSIPTLPAHVIEPFLNEAIIVGETDLDRAPRIVAAADTRVLITRGDRAYVRGRNGSPLVETDPRRIDSFRVFRNVVPLRDPLTSVVLGYEARYLGHADLVRGETVQPVRMPSGEMAQTIIPASIDVVSAREEMRVGDRLLPEPARVFSSYVPRAPTQPVDASIVSVYGDAVAMAGPNQVVAISRGAADGIENGHVLAILRTGRRIDDRTQADERAVIKVPDERTGLMMVFRTFDRISYALVLEVSAAVQVGDRVINPQ